jgi:Fe-S cluster assembly iron-binding protein IscA
MLTVSDKAVSLLKAAKLTEGAPAEAGVRIQRGATAEDRGAVTLSLAIREAPVPSDESFEQDGLRIFVEDVLVQPLDGRTLDVSEDNGGMELVLR